MNCKEKEKGRTIKGDVPQRKGNDEPNSDKSTSVRHRPSGGSAAPNKNDKHATNE
jgi:hypothetical protein